MIVNPVVYGGEGGNAKWIELEKSSQVTRAGFGDGIFVTKEILPEDCCIVIYSSGSNTSGPAYGAITVLNANGEIYTAHIGSVFNLNVRKATFDNATSKITMSLDCGDTKAPQEAYYMVIKK